VATTTARQRTLFLFRWIRSRYPPSFPHGGNVLPVEDPHPCVSDRVEDVRLEFTRDRIADRVGRAGTRPHHFPLPECAARDDGQESRSIHPTVPDRGTRSAIRRVSSRSRTEGLPDLLPQRRRDLRLTSGGDEKDVVRLLCAVGKDHAVPGRVDPLALFRAGRGFPGRPGL